MFVGVSLPRLFYPVKIPKPGIIFGYRIFSVDIPFGGSLWRMYAATPYSPNGEVAVFIKLIDEMIINNHFYRFFFQK